jgi:hypothetical protein
MKKKKKKIAAKPRRGLSAGGAARGALAVLIKIKNRKGLL